MKKKILFAAPFMRATVGAYAQGNGIASITEATYMITSYFVPGGLRFCLTPATIEGGRCNEN